MYKATIARMRILGDTVRFRDTVTYGFLTVSDCMMVIMRWNCNACDWYYCPLTISAVDPITYDLLEKGKQTPQIIGPEKPPNEIKLTEDKKCIQFI